MERHDVGMVQRRRRPRLPLEARPPIGPAEGLAVENFDGHTADQAGIVGAVHFAHTARAERRDNLVGIQPGAAVRDMPPTILLECYGPAALFTDRMAAWRSPEARASKPGRVATARKRTLHLRPFMSAEAIV